MAWTTIVAIYFITWWVVLFAILPWGVKSQTEHDEEITPGTDPGAPILPRLGMKIVWTTIVSTVLYVTVYYVFANRWITIEDMASWIGMPK